MSYLRNNQERSIFLIGQVAQAVGNYLERLECYVEAREEYQQAQLAYEQVLAGDADYLEAQNNREILRQKLEELPTTQKSSEDYRLELLFTDNKQKAIAGIQSTSPSLTEKFTQWLTTIFDENWQTLDNFLGGGEANFAYAYALRSGNVQGLEKVLQELQQNGLEIPGTAFGGHRNLKVGDYSLQLHALIWFILTQEKTMEWTLLLILGMQSGEVLPEALKLQVRDQSQILVERQVGNNTNENYLYARVIGSWDEQFTAIISLANGESVTLPAFTLLQQSSDFLPTK